MANESPTGSFEKKILIALESTMSGVRDTIRSLESMRKHLDRTGASTKSINKATADLSRTYSKASKDVAKLGNKFKSLKKVQKGMFEIMRSIGSVTRTSLGVATVAAGAFIAETKRIGDTMLKFEITSLNASRAIETLGEAYGSLKAQSNSAILSMQDVAAELTKFQSQGIAHMSATMKKEFTAGYVGIQSVLTQVLGKTNASDAMGAFVSSLGDEFEFLRTTIGGDLGKIAQDIQKTVDPKIKAQFIDDAIEKMVKLQKRTNDQGTAARMVIGQMVKLRDVTLGGGSDITKGVIAINAAWAKFGTVVENVSTDLIKTFGPDLGDMITGIGGWLESRVEPALLKIIQKTKDLHVRFVEWGGTKQLIDTLTRALDFVWQTISKITVAGLSFIKWITEANAATQILVAGMASLVLAPGLLPGVFTLVTGLGSVTKAAYSAAVAMKAMNVAQMAGMAKMFAGRLGMVGAAATVGHLGGKALGGFDPNTFGDALSGAAGAAVTGAMVGSVIPGIGTAVGAAIGGIGSLIVSAIGSWGHDTEKVIKRIQPPKIPDAFTKKMDKLQKTVDKLQAQNLARLAEETKKVGEEAAKTEDKFADFVIRLKDLDTLTKRILPGFSQSISGISAIIDTLGPTTDQFGENISNLIKRFSMDEMTHGFKSVQEYANLAAEQIALIDMARTREDFDEVEQHARLFGEALANIEKVTGNLKQALEGSLKPLEKQIELISSIKDLRQLDLDISQQLYGTPALAVQAQLALVETMQVEKELLKDQLAVTQGIIAQRLTEGAAEKDIFFLRMRELDISKKIKGVTRDQLRQVKELRDGYLSAVTAQAFGAGRFSKILITQEQNLGRGLIQEVVKPNFLLGQAGAAAGASRADPYRFSAQGIGFLETLSGQTLHPEDVAKTVYDRVANISDPLSKASALQSADIFMDIMNGADKNTKDLGNVFMLGSDRQVDAINALAEKLHPASATAAALTGTPAGGIVTGSAIERKGRGQSVPLTNADYRRQAQQQGSAIASIEAFFKYSQTNEDKIVPKVKDPAAEGSAALYSDMMKSFDIQMKIPNAKEKENEAFSEAFSFSTSMPSTNSKKLEGDLDKIRDSIKFRSEALKSEFGDEGFKAIGDALKLFDQTITNKASAKIEMLTDQIGHLLGKNVEFPENRDKLKELRQERTDLIEDFNLGGVSTAGPQSLSVVRKKQGSTKSKVETSNPGRSTKLSHGLGQNSNGQSLKKELELVAYHSQRAAQLAGEMGSKVDILNEEQDKKSQYAGGRLVAVQAVSP